MNEARPILEVRNLRVRRGGVPVLDIPGLALADGEVLSLIGPNGAGKSSLLLALARLLPASGERLFRGQAVSKGSGVLSYRRKVAMVFQEPLLFDTTVFANVASGLKLWGIQRQEIQERVHASLDQFGVAHLAQRHARALSGGEAQRTSLARAFAIRPEIIFLDEPFSSLDPPTREGLIEDLLRILRDTKTTAVMATHDRIEALRLSSLLAVMTTGGIVQVGPPEEVMNAPVDEFVASFVGMETLIPGEVVRASVGTVAVSVGGREIEALGSFLPGEKVICCIRPEQVTLSVGTFPEGSSARNILPGIVVQVTPLGLFHRVWVDSGFPIRAFVTASALEELSIEEGKPVWASFKATQTHVMRSK